MKIDIDKLRAAHAATTQEGWGAEWKPKFTGYGGASYAITAEYAGGQQPILHVESGFGLPKSNIAFIALAHNEFPAMLDEIEHLRDEVETLRAKG